jgi:hypothetical protein
MRAPPLVDRSDNSAGSASPITERSQDSSAAKIQDELAESLSYLESASAEDNPTFSYDFENSERAIWIAGQWYSHLTGNENLIWPRDFQPRIPPSNIRVRAYCLHIAFRMLWALGSQWIGVLRPLDYRMMCFIVNRTWTWHKPREAISLRMFREGVFDNETGECLQAGIGSNDAGILRAREKLYGAGLLSYGTARSSILNTRICWYEVNATHLLGGADDLRICPAYREDMRTQFKEGDACEIVGDTRLQT